MMVTLQLTLNEISYGKTKILTLNEPFLETNFYILQLFVQNRGLQ